MSNPIISPSCASHLSNSLSFSNNERNRNYPKVAGMLLRYFFRRARYSPCSRDFYDFYIYIYMCVCIRFIRLLTEQGMNEMQMHMKKFLRRLFGIF